jgi:hypothetical protein
VLSEVFTPYPYTQVEQAAPVPEAQLRAVNVPVLHELDAKVSDSRHPVHVSATAPVLQYPVLVVNSTEEHIVAGERITYPGMQVPQAVAEVQVAHILGHAVQEFGEAPARK